MSNLDSGVAAAYFILPLLLTTFALAALHWFPWHGGTRELGRIASYTVGTLVIVGVPVCAMLVAMLTGAHFPLWFWALLLVANTAAGGLTVTVAHLYDRARPISRGDAANAAQRREQ